ncbi:MAG: hypothetical protein JWL71_4233 [Acidobacteria bacterium]|nr:hypothetical protein [Acidobacteriota bacterium]
MIAASMPSPIGHALAGVAVAWTADLIPGHRARRTGPEPCAGSWYQRGGGHLTVVCAALAAAPDLDLALMAHRTATHSIGAVLIVALCAAALAAAGRQPIARVTLMCAAAYGSHLLLDWLGADYYPPRGLQLLWPFSREWYISGLDLFRQTARLRIFTRGPMRTNVRAILQELAILVPVLALLWTARTEKLRIKN